MILGDSSNRANDKRTDHKQSRNDDGICVFVVSAAEIQLSALLVITSQLVDGDLAVENNCLDGFIDLNNTRKFVLPGAVTEQMRKFRGTRQSRP